MQGRAAAMSGRGWVALLLCVGGGLVALAFALNLLVDPFDVRSGGVLPPAVEADRRVKLDLVDRLRRPPEVVVLGSSRARMADPSTLRRLTGLRAFNAAVTGGTAVDGYVFARYIAARFPGSVQHVIWFVDADTLAGNGVNPQLARDARAAPWLPEWAGDGRPGAGELVPYLGLDALEATARVGWACATGPCRSAGSDEYTPAGGLRRAMRAAAAGRLAVEVGRLVEAAERGGTERRRPSNYQMLERAIAWLNGRGVEPVLVLNPVHPRLLAARRAVGWPGKADAAAFLGELRSRVRFRVVDLTDVTSFGADPDGFVDATHVSRATMQRALEAIVARAGDALR